MPLYWVRCASIWPCCGWAASSPPSSRIRPRTYGARTRHPGTPRWI